MLRIDVKEESTQQTVLEIAGRLADDEVSFVEGEIKCWLTRTERLVLNLRGVKFIDRAGVAMLKEWVGERLQLQGGSRFIGTLLETNGLEMY